MATRTDSLTCLVRMIASMPAADRLTRRTFASAATPPTFVRRGNASPPRTAFARDGVRPGARVAVKFAGSTSTYPPVTIMPPTRQHVDAECETAERPLGVERIIVGTEIPGDGPDRSRGPRTSVRQRAWQGQRFAAGATRTGSYPSERRRSIFEMIDYDGPTASLPISALRA